MRTQLLALAAVLGLSLAAAFAGPQDEPAPPTKDDTAKEYIDGVKKELGKQDGEAARIASTRLLEIWRDGEISADAKKEVPDLIEKIADSKDENAAVAGIEGLQSMGGEDAAKSLKKVVEKALKAKEPPVQIYSAALKALGVLRNEDAKIVDLLVKLLKHQDHDVVGKAAGALAGYGPASGKLRKELLEEVIKQSEGVYTASNNNDQNAKRKWNIIQSGIMKALNALSGQSFKDPAEARQWYNDHKKDRDLWK